MKFTLPVLGAAAIGALALMGVAIAQPVGAPGKPGGFGLLQHDANGDGRLTRSEFDTAQKARFAAMDANKDGTATTEEVRALRQSRAADVRTAALAQRFDALDADKNGQLSRAEFSARATADDGARHHRGGRDGRRGGRGPGRHAGPGPDGNLTLSAFSARGAEAFTAADADRDGVVTIAELQALRPHRR